MRVHNFNCMPNNTSPEKNNTTTQTFRLSELKNGESAVVYKILGHGAFRKRVMEMGFVRGRDVRVVLSAPLQDPVKYHIMDSDVSLRRSEAKLIEVYKPDDSNICPNIIEPVAVAVDNNEFSTKHPKYGYGQTINIALIGNPNCGKTSLFNNLTGYHEHVGNYSGVTVGAVSGQLDYKGYKINVVDLPGTYSLASYSPEERYVRKYLREETPDVIVNVVDASNLERNLYLSTELIDMDRSMVIALNMYDELEKSKASLDYNMLGSMIGVPIVPTISKNGTGVDNLLNCIINVFEGDDKTVRHIHVKLGPEIENTVNILKNAIKSKGETGHHISPRYIAIKLLENDSETVQHVETTPSGQEIITLRDKLAKRLQQHYGEDISEIIASEKYGFIAGATAETMLRDKDSRRTTAIIDSLVTNQYVGFPLFFGIMFLTFWLTFVLGSYPSDWIQHGVDALSALVAAKFPQGILKDLIADGIIGGLGGVIVFLPNILILYFCISFMEDTGYMARAAFIMDKIMHKIGLHGKSFIPLVMGFGCNVPAIMASRTIESRSSRIITILINPFMSCSARVPIYVLLVGTFFSRHAALVFMSLYLIGIFMAIITAKLLRKFIFKSDETPFVMELPPYRMPQLRTSIMHTWKKGEQYLRKMGGLILVASVIVWALNYFPEGFNRTDGSGKIESEQPAANANHRDSYLESVGKFITPVMKPLGFDWQATVAAIAGLPAKEIVVSTLGVLFTDDEAVDDSTLGKRLMSINPATHAPYFTAASALSFMIFILLYCPCTATLVAIARETKSWRYSIFAAVYNTAMAWIVAFVIYNIACLF